MPALLTSTSIWPKRREHAVDRRSALLEVGDVAGHADVLIADLRRGGLGLLGVEIEDGDACAFAGEQLRGGHAEPAPRSGTGDDAAFVLKQHGGKTRDARASLSAVYGEDMSRHRFLPRLRQFAPAFLLNCYV